MRESAVREMIAALGRYVKATRLLLGWSQEHLADVARTSQGLISRMEAGHCVNLPFMSVLKVLTALAASESPIGDAIPAPFHVVLACAALPGTRPLPPDPHLAQLLQAYHALPPARQPALVQMLCSMLTMVDDDAHEPEVTTG